MVPPYLAALVDEPLALRLTGRCAIRSTTSVVLSDEDWFELTREVRDATGIESDDLPG